MAIRSTSAERNPRPDARAIWQRALEHVRHQLETQAYETWFAGTSPHEIRGGVLHINVPTVIHLDTLRGSYFPILASAVKQAAGRPMEVELRVAARTDRTDPGLAIPAPQTEAEDGAAARKGRMRPVLKAEFTFDRFIEGTSNQFALAAARRVARHPGEDLNPLFIYADSGLGKTHLLHAIGHELMPRYHTAVVQAQRYLREFVSSVTEGTRATFQEKYESLDVLIVDDIQGLNRGVQTQEEFFNVFSELHQHGRQIVIASDVPPRQLTGLTDRLVTRFGGGLVVEITPPDVELCEAILAQHARMLRLDVPEEQIQLIAARGGPEVRSLLEALNRVRMYSELERAPVTRDLVLRALGDRAPEERRRSQPTVAELIAAVSELTGVAPDLFTSKRKDRRTSQARQLVMYLACEHTDLSQQLIGAALGGRHHTTVLHGRDKVAGQLKRPSDPNGQMWIQQIAELRSRLRLEA